MSVNDQVPNKKILQQQEEDAKAQEASQKEAAHREAQNRFKKLQQEYGKSFKYQYYSSDLRINSRSCYLPFEGRFDEETFDLFLFHTIPKELMFVTSCDKKV